MANSLPAIEDRYRVDGIEYDGHLVLAANPGSAPAILMIPNWMGASPASVEKATRIAQMGFNVYVADVYGVENRPSDARGAAAVAGSLRADRDEMRRRVLAAHERLLLLGGQHGVQTSRVAAIGFCFGGGAVLETARSGAPLAAVVSFHGDLLSPTLETDSSRITGRVLVLHGAADPFVPPEHVAQFQKVMSGTSVDWQFISFGGAVHSFTDPHANMTGQAQYDALTAHRAFAYMDAFLREVFSGKE